MKVALLFLALTGCQLVFELEDNPTEEGPDEPFEACGVQRHDELRYLFLDSGGGINWVNARTACQRRAMDLAVFDTQTELEDVRGEAPPAYWLGVMGNNVIDDCAPALDFGPGQPQDPSGCLMVADSAFDMAQVSCDADSAPDGGIANALCETPRLSEVCHAIPQGPYEARLDPLPFAVAANACELVEINSPAELAKVEAAAKAMGLDEFWVAPRWSGSEWESPGENCPSVFNWAPNEPDIVGGQVKCTVHNLALGTFTRDCTMPTTVLCEH